MKSSSRSTLTTAIGLALLSVLVVACSAGSEPLVATEVVKPGDGQVEEAEHEDDEHTPDEHMVGAHDVPDDAAAVPNPFAGDEESTAAGAVLFAASCAICHGATGEGDGPAAAGLEKPPADLHMGHVQENSDGALFYIISHGKPETPMPAFDDILDENERWNVVNFLRTFQEQ